MAMFKSLSEGLKNADSCTTLKLSLKGKELPPELFTLTKLEELYLEAPQLKELPDMMSFESLKLLSLKAVVFKGSVAELFHLPSLRNLKLIETPLEPLTIKLATKMAPLQWLTMKACGLKALPLEMGELATLEELILPDNALKELPFTFNGLIKLKRLNLDGNAFKKFPDHLNELKKLLHVSIDGNHFPDDEKARIQRQFGLSPN